MSTIPALPEEPPRGPGWEVPPPNPAPERGHIDPINVPTPGPDVILPGDEPVGIPAPPGMDIPDTPIPSEVSILTFEHSPSSGVF